MLVLQLNTWIDEFGKDNLNLDKLQEYLDFIKEATERYDPSRYSEWHHVMPRCVDKESKYQDQGVRINGRDHFLAHKFLVGIFTDSERKKKLSFAMTKMLGHLRKEITPEDYELARKLNREALIGNQYAKGIKFSEDALRRMSENHRKYDTEETKKRRSESLKGHEVSETMRSQISSKLKKYYEDHPERKEELSIQRSERNRIYKDKAREGLLEYYRTHVVSEEIRKKISEKVSGEKNGMYGKTHSEEARRNMSESRKGNSNSKGNIWITNGIDNKIIKDLKDLPEGWWNGRTIKRR